jgi:hypothetical protein
MRQEIKDRYYRTFTYQAVDRVPDIEFGYWPQTIRRWMKEGMTADLTPEEQKECFPKKLDAFFGFLAFVLNFIPDIGSLIATALRVGFAFFQFGTFWTPFWILVITVGLDSIFGYFIEPKIMGKGLGLSPLLVFFSLLFWGWLWGIPGMILSVPLTAVIKIVCQNVPALRPVAVLMGT